ncbi:hypothetical protein NG798_27305 [Ancylothrix sp. C2]|uniref:hypothetical protein n=1 Tax=Ancylothrix sp. D3o TaxID=2953691 RepID=UPI0021BAB9BD|nr:hypothetical protein [Ancylothrix sp. D3o]MCT7953508.1 hypothetical protein [Ancylothrix sp. D3o]
MWIFHWFLWAPVKRRINADVPPTYFGAGDATVKADFPLASLGAGETEINALEPPACFGAGDKGIDTDVPAASLGAGDTAN